MKDARQSWTVKLLQREDRRRKSENPSSDERYFAKGGHCTQAPASKETRSQRNIVQDRGCYNTIKRAYDLTRDRFWFSHRRGVGV